MLAETDDCRITNFDPLTYAGNLDNLEGLEETRHLVLSDALNDEPIPVYGDGRNVRDWIYVEDHCRAILLAMEKEGQVRFTTLADFKRWFDLFTLIT